MTEINSCRPLMAPSNRILLILLIVVPTLTFAQTASDRTSDIDVPDPETVNSPTARDSDHYALVLARRGDLEKAKKWVQKSAAMRRHGFSLQTELLIESADLAQSCLQCGAYAAAKEIADETITRIYSSKTHGTEGEILQLSLLEGELNEKIYHNRQLAKAAYVRAAASDPENQQARDGIARINLFDAVTEQKIQEQKLIAEALKGTP